MTKELNDFSPYAKFCMELKGYSLLDTRNGQTYSKLDLWLKYNKKDDTQILLLLKDKHPYYVRINKPGWHNGVLTEKPGKNG